MILALAVVEKNIRNAAEQINSWGDDVLLIEKALGDLKGIEKTIEELRGSLWHWIIGKKIWRIPRNNGYGKLLGWWR
jgi:hypothetical protein